MTLVIFVRCQDGCILASDRKASSTTGNREESKVRFNNSGWAIAAAGDDASAIISLYYALDSNPVTPSNIESLIVNTLGNYNRTSRI
jgi:20S proteasome alpha/beta subunit